MSAAPAPSAPARTGSRKALAATVWWWAAGLSMWLVGWFADGLPLGPTLPWSITVVCLVLAWRCVGRLRQGDSLILFVSAILWFALWTPLALGFGWVGLWNLVASRQHPAVPWFALVGAVHALAAILVCWVLLRGLVQLRRGGPRPPYVFRPTAEKVGGTVALAVVWYLALWLPRGLCDCMGAFTGDWSGFANCTDYYGMSLLKPGCHCRCMTFMEMVTANLTVLGPPLVLYVLWSRAQGIQSAIARRQP